MTLAPVFLASGVPLFNSAGEPAFAVDPCDCCEGGMPCVVASYVNNFTQAHPSSFWGLDVQPDGPWVNSETSNVFVRNGQLEFRTSEAIAGQARTGLCIDRNDFVLRITVAGMHVEEFLSSIFRTAFEIRLGTVLFPGVSTLAVIRGTWSGSDWNLLPLQWYNGHDNRTPLHEFNNGDVLEIDCRTGAVSVNGNLIFTNPDGCLIDQEKRLRMVLDEHDPDLRSTVDLAQLEVLAA